MSSAPRRLRRKAVFVIFAIVSLARAAIYVLALAGVVSEKWVYQLNLMVAPQAFVFTHPIYYQALRICVYDPGAPPACFKNGDLVTKMLPSPYYISSVAVNHAFAEMQVFPEDPASVEDSRIALEAICSVTHRRRVQVFYKNFAGTEEAHGEEVREYDCPAGS